jgi:hypothetical protein
MKGKTKSGFEFNVDERMLEDWHVVDAIGMSESDDPSEQIAGARMLVDLILGKDKKRLMDFLAKKNDGYVPATAMTAAIAEIITESKELKNSQSSEG